MILILTGQNRIKQEGKRVASQSTNHTTLGKNPVLYFLETLEHPDYVIDDIIVGEQ